MNITIDNGKRLLGLKELMSYLSVGKNKAREYGKETGAVVKMGGRTLYDRHIIDMSLDKALAAGSGSKE